MGAPPSFLASETTDDENEEQPMRAVMVMFDSLNRRLLPNYGNDWTSTPNFARLGRRAATFDTCYAGSMPCMPARRELHTGRYNFLERSWGPLEPFDDSVPEMLRNAGVYSHLVTDHLHYWEDGGATYHQRFSTFEFFRGQEGDPWKGMVRDPDIPEGAAALHVTQTDVWRQDWVNRRYLQHVEDHPQTRTFDAGVEFVRENAGEDRWFLQIETFDPHEPFYSYAQHKKLYPHEYDGPHYDWPDYRPTDGDDPATIEHVRMEYAALLSMCDDSLGRVLDLFDELSLWDDTMLIVCTDHGFLLGEHGWWGKNTPPWYDENIHTPLFVWDPRTAVAGERRSALVQTVDLGPTLLEYFGLELTADMQGRPLAGAIEADAPVREYALFGGFGGHVNITDGRYVYMRSCADASNQPLLEHTLMPTHMRARFRPEELVDAELVRGLPHTKGAPVLRMPASFATAQPWYFGTLLWDLEADPDQEHPLDDPALELRMLTALRDEMVRHNAPSSQFERLGIPERGHLGDEHLAVRRDAKRLAEGDLPPLPSQHSGGFSVTAAAV
jgi:arylsulfatase A-like enzyme